MFWQGISNCWPRLRCKASPTCPPGDRFDRKCCMTTPYSGRLELTWTNKDKTLLAHENQSYEWVSPADYRVSEVRLLHDVESVGHTAPEPKRATDNLLIRGDALHVLNALTSIPEFAREYV